jgi:tetratricopeptide (TPR) repeat protein
MKTDSFRTISSHVVSNIDKSPICSCSGTSYSGTLCEVSMKPTPNLLVAVAILLFSFAAAAQTYPGSSDSELHLGVEAYKNSQYEEAIQHFEKAVELDGSNLKARLYLATAYVSQYIPGVDSPDNLQAAEKAIDQYQHVLDASDDRNSKINSAKGIAYIDLNMKKFDDAKKYYQIAIDLDPDDPESRYSIGVIDWTKCYAPRMEARAKLDMRPEENLNPENEAQKKACDELRAKNKAAIEEGIASLNKAIELRPDYDDAMAYLNLMYREKADVECDDLAARAEDLKTADQWVDKIMAVKKAKAEKQQPINPQRDQQQ